MGLQEFSGRSGGTGMVTGSIRDTIKMAFEI